MPYTKKYNKYFLSHGSRPTVSRHHMDKQAFSPHCFSDKNVVIQSFAARECHANQMQITFHLAKKALKQCFLFYLVHGSKDKLVGA